MLNFQLSNQREEVVNIFLVCMNFGSYDTSSQHIFFRNRC